MKSIIIHFVLSWSTRKNLIKSQTMKRTSILIINIFFALTCFAQSESPAYEQNWPEWRGPYMTGEAPTGTPPTQWSESENVKWKVEIKGSGHATPIVWGNQVFVQSAYDTGRKPANSPSSEESGGFGLAPGAENIFDFILTSYNKNDGSIIWQKTLASELPQERTHEDGSWSSNSPVTDGEHVYAYFGSRGLFCLDMEGNQIWSRDFGQMEKKMSFGEGSSPALYGDKIVILWDHEGESSIFVLDKNTGEDIWNAKRNEATTWTTPIIINYNGQAQIIAPATNKVLSYELNTGNIIWETSGLTENVIPHPMYKDGVVYLMSGYRGYSIFAVDMAKAKGDITDSDAIIWSYNRNTSYVPSALLADDKIYYLRDNRGSLSCISAIDGTIYYEREELEDFGMAYPSPVAAGGKLYLIGGDGISYVATQGENFEIISTNKLDDKFSASPVVVGNDLFLRSFNYLYCISED